MSLVQRTGRLTVWSERVKRALLAARVCSRGLLAPERDEPATSLAGGLGEGEVVAATARRGEVGARLWSLLKDAGGGGTRVWKV